MIKNKDADGFEIQAGKQMAFLETLTLINEAEAKWESECCEWEWFEVDGVRTYANCKYSRDTLDLREMSDFKFCPYCGRKISEVE